MRLGGWNSRTYCSLYVLVVRLVQKRSQKEGLGMSESLATKFSIKINGGRERSMVCASSIYIDAVAAVPAMFGIGRNAWPVQVEIWATDLAERAPHHRMVIEEDRAGRIVVGVDASLSTEAIG